jgi:hypothetical protein
MVESLEAQRGPCKSNARQDAPCYVAGLQAQPTLRVDSSRSEVVELGHRIQPGQMLLAMVPVDDIWVTANFSRCTER